MFPLLGVPVISHPLLITVFSLLSLSTLYQSFSIPINYVIPSSSRLYFTLQCMFTYLQALNLCSPCFPGHSISRCLLPSFVFQTQKQLPRDIVTILKKQFINISTLLNEWLLQLRLCITNSYVIKHAFDNEYWDKWTKFTTQDFNVSKCPNPPHVTVKCSLVLKLPESEFETSCDEDLCRFGCDINLTSQTLDKQIHTPETYIF